MGTLSQNNNHWSIKILLLTVVFVGAVSYANAVTEEQLTEQISSHTDTISSLEAEIKEYQQKLTTVGTQKESLQKKVSQLALSQKKLEAETALTNKKISVAEQKIKDLSNSISDTGETITMSKTATGLSIALLNEYESMTLVERLTGRLSLGDVWQGIDESARVRESLLEHITMLKTTKIALVTDKTAVESEKTKLRSLTDKLADQKKIVLENKKEQQQLLTETNNQESTYKTVIAQKEALRKAYENELRQYESELHYILNPSSLPKPGTGALGWPLSNVYITQLFGKTSDSGRLYASGSHSGWDFRADIGTPVFAQGSGIVEGTGDTDVACKGASFGKWVYIRYGNGLGVTYGHLSVIKASKGQSVKAGDLIAYSGFTGHSTAPHLHTGVYAADGVEISGKESLSCKGKILIQPRAALNAYLDPALYFPKASKDMIKPGAGAY